MVAGVRGMPLCNTEDKGYPDPSADSASSLGKTEYFLVLITLKLL